MKNSDLLFAFTLITFPTFAQASQLIKSASPKDEGPTIEVISITSQRVTRPIEEIANNLTLVPATIVEDLHLTNLNELLSIVPNVSMNSLLGDYDYIQIRGMPRNLEQATVGLYIDGVPYTSLYGLNINLIDIQSVEVLRGPQGNLFGKNTRDGVIAINTRQDSDSFSSKVTAGIGSFNQKLLTTTATVPLIADSLTLNVAGQMLSRDGAVANHHLNQTLDSIDQTTARVNLDWDITPDFSLSITGNYVNKDNGSYPFVQSSIDLKRGDELVASLDTTNQLKQDVNNLSLFLNWQLSELWHIDAITSWDNTKTFGRFDADFSTQSFGHQDTWLKEEEFYQELRLTSVPGNGSIDYLFGLSANKSEDSNRNEWMVGLSSIDGQFSKDALVAYADFTWRLTSDWRIQSGIRWLNETIKVDSVFTNPYVPVPSIKTTGSTSQSDSEWLGKFAINKLLSDNQNIFLSWGQGYLSGGASWIAESSDQQGYRLGYGVIYQPENSQTMELGYRAQLLSKRVYIELVTFNGKINEYQYASMDVLGASRIKTIKEVNSRGAEASVNIKLGSQFDWLTNIGFNDTTITDIGNLFQEGHLWNIEEGQRIPNAPKYNVHTHLSHHININKFWAITSNINLQRFGATTFDLSGSEEQKPYNVLNSTFTLQYLDNWQISLWFKNMTDERYKTYQIQFGSGALASYGTPRQFGLDVSWSY